MISIALAGSIIASVLYSFVRHSVDVKDEEDNEMIQMLHPVRSVSSFTAIGKRDHQEDRSLICNFGPSNQYFLATISDGHSNKDCSSFLVENIQSCILHRLIGIHSQHPIPWTDTGEQLKRGCMDLHLLWDSNKTRFSPSGATLTGIFVDRQDPDTIWSFNLGDSKSVLYLDGGQHVLATISHDLSLNRQRQILQHDPFAMIEHDDEGTFRLFGQYAGVNMSGSFGNTYDPVLSKSLLRGVEVQKWSIADCSHARVVIGSDGIWDDFSPVAVSKVLRGTYEQASMNARGLVHYVLENGKKGDNTTAIIIDFD